ncbi:MAG: PIN domain-containing protein [Acidobacteriota bacterium]|nr:PIN domain-containing protein [Acidobacteriota bacterium]
MILVDTSIWIDHLRSNNSVLRSLLLNKQVLSHPFVIGEIAMGSLKDRFNLLAELRALPRLTIARDENVLALVNDGALFGKGIGYIDAHLIASLRLAPRATLWTRDKRLQALAASFVSISAPR